MTLVRKTMTALVLASCLAAPPTLSADRDADWVAARVAELQPKPEERRFDQIGWAPDIRAALRLAREHGRPVFLFTMDGRIHIGRC